MKILYLHQYFNTPQMSGGTRSFELARRFVAQGHEVHVVTADREASDSTTWRVERIEGIHVHWIPIPYDNGMSYARRIWAFFRFAIAASWRASRIGADVIFATSTPLTIAIPGVVAKRLLKAPMVFEVRDLWPELPIAVGALKNPAQRWAAKRLELWAYRNSDHVVALSPGMEEGVARTGYPTDKITMAPNACDSEFSDVSRDAVDDFLTSRPWLRGKQIVLYAGTLGKINGVEYLVGVAEELAVLQSDMAIVVIGDGAERNAIVASARSAGVYGENFFWEPPIPKAEMPAALSAAAVCTSLFLPVPEMEANSANKFFDALAAGRPVAVNYGGWHAEMVRKHQLGLVLPREPALAARELASLVGDFERREVAGEAGRELARSRFSRDAVAGQVLTCLEATIPGGR